MGMSPLVVPVPVKRQRLTFAFEDIMHLDMKNTPWWNRRIGQQIRSLDAVDYALGPVKRIPQRRRGDFPNLYPFATLGVTRHIEFNGPKIRDIYRTLWKSSGSHYLIISLVRSVMQPSKTMFL